jgi:hypothetical protein
MQLDHLQLDYWTRCSDSERNVLAQQLASNLPSPFRLTEIQWYELGGQRHPIACFDHDGSMFALIPGSTATLGYDSNKPFPATPQQIESWNKTVAEFELKGTLDEDIGDQTTPLRTASINSFLVEVSSREVGLEPIELTGRTGKGQMLAPGTAVEQYQPNGTHLRIENPSGRMERAYWVKWQTHEQVSREVTAQGFRLLSSDEWEYACAAGSRTLFRWGNDYPGDCDPGYRSSPDCIHCKRNAFGLNIAQNPYDWEFVSEPSLLRGGDGGSMSSGGAGIFVSWLTLASAYIDKFSNHWEGKPVPGAHLRRVFSLK